MQNGIYNCTADKEIKALSFAVRVIDDVANGVQCRTLKNGKPVWVAYKTKLQNVAITEAFETQMTAFGLSGCQDYLDVYPE